MTVRGKGRIMGLEIDTDFVRAVELEKTADGLKLNKLGAIPTPTNVIIDGAVSDVNALGGSIRGLMNANNMTARQAVVGISGSGVISRLMTLPRMPRDEMRQVVKGEVEQYAIFEAGEEVVVDFQPVEDIVERDVEKARVLVVAIQKRLVDSYAMALKVAGLGLESVDVASVAVLRSLAESNLKVVLGEVVASVVIGGSTSDIHILDGGILRFVRTIDVGTDRIVGAIGVGGEVDFEVTEEGEIGEAKGQFVNALATELRHSLYFYRTQFPKSKKLKKIVLTLDSHRFKNLDRSLAANLDVSVEVGDPLAGMIWEGLAPEPEYVDRMTPSLAVAVGSAMRGLEGIDAAYPVSLLPVERRGRGEFRKRVAAVVSSLVLLPAIFGVVGLLLGGKINSREEQLSAIEAQVAQARVVSEEKEPLRQLAAVLKEKSGSIKHVEGLSWSEILGEIGKMLPQDSWLASVRASESNVLSVEGISFSQDSVVKFLRTLDSSRFFESVTLDFASSDKMGERVVVKFKVDCQVPTGKKVR